MVLLGALLLASCALIGSDVLGILARHWRRCKRLSRQRWFQ